MHADWGKVAQIHFMSYKLFKFKYLCFGASLVIYFFWFLNWVIQVARICASLCGFYAHVLAILAAGSCRCVREGAWILINAAVARKARRSPAFSRPIREARRSPALISRRGNCDIRRWRGVRVTTENRCFGSRDTRNHAPSAFWAAYMHTRRQLKYKKKNT